MNTRRKIQTTDLHDQLRDIADGIEQLRRLMILALIRNGASQGDVADTLGITQGTVSKLFSKPKNGSRKR